jgi:phage shock protein A
LTAAFLILALVLGASSEGAAQDRYVQQISAFRAVLAEQADLDKGQLAADERALMEQWLQEAEALLKKGDRTGAARRLKRVEDGMELVRALVVASQMAGDADTQEQSAKAAAEQVESMKKEIEALVAKRQELQSQLQQLR